VTTSLLLTGMSAHETQTDILDSKIEWAHRHGQAVDRWALTVLLGIVVVLLLIWA
jgi:hypothetical protein